MDNFQKKECIYCGKGIIGRIDKKYCDAYCRNSHNNVNNSSEELEMKAINRQLRLNRRILKSLCPEGKSTVRKEVLHNLGFDFSKFNSIFPSSGNVYYLIYDYGFMPIYERTSIEKVVIVKRQQYMQTFDPWSYLKK